MELAARYAFMVYEKKSFSAAAKALFISQPALSAAISRLEEELGFRVFDRKSVPLTLTPEGRIYIESLLEIKESEMLMREKINRLSDTGYGKLAVGGSCLAAYQLLAVITAEYHRRFPKIEVEIDMGNIGTYSYLLEKMNRHSIDLLVGHKFSSKEYDLTPILNEQYLIAMRRDYPGAEELMKYAITREELLSGSYDKNKEIDDMSLFAEIKFLKMSKGSTPAVKMDKLIGEYKVAKCSVKNVRHAGMQFNMMRFGLGAVMTSDTIVKMLASNNEDVVYFIPKSDEAKQTLYIAQDKSYPPTVAAQSFLSLAKEMCESNSIF